jgi:hypothetical protein
MTLCTANVSPLNRKLLAIMILESFPNTALGAFDCASPSTYVSFRWPSDRSEGLGIYPTRSGFAW